MEIYCLCLGDACRDKYLLWSLLTMSEAGFKTRTDSGVMQLDSNYENYSLLKKVKGTLKGDIIFQFGYGYLDITANYKDPILVAIKGTYTGQKVFHYYTLKNSDNTYSIRVIGSVNTEVEVYIYSNAPIFKAKNGLNIYDDTGQLTFSSETPYLWLDNIVNVTPQDVFGGQVIASRNNNSQIAICMPPMTSFLRGQPILYSLKPFASFPAIYNGTSYQLVRQAENLFYIMDGLPVADSYVVYGSFILVDIRNTTGMNWESI